MKTGEVTAGVVSTCDKLNRPATAQEQSGSSWTQTNGYDRYGNRTVTAGSGLALTFNAANNRITKKGYYYDAAGNLTEDPGHSYIYDAENKMLKLDNVTAYSYDGEGKRVRKYVGENTRFVYGIGGQLLAEYNGSSGAITKEYIYGASGLTAVVDASNGTEYLTPDHLGSPRINTDGSGAVTSRDDYLPFGEEVTTGAGRTSGGGWASSNSPRQKFTGYERDAESGLDFAQARYFSQGLGRFTSADPIQVTPTRMTDPQQFNSYAYARNNPLVYVDPTGLDSEATDFASFDKLSNKQQELLMGYLKTTDRSEAATKWTEFYTKNNSSAAAFLATTNALSKTTLELGGGKTMNALDLITSISDIKRDRIEGTVSKESFDAWTGAGEGGFSIALANGKTESGKVTFKDRSDGYGSVHDGFDRQGYTSGNTNFPRIQWNYRDRDSGIDIDLDGHKPWLVPFLAPNPKHRDNSDARQWHEKYVDKFGNPGFNVREVKEKKN